LVRGKYVEVDKREFEDIARAIAARRKDAILSVRVNSQDLRKLKLKARRLGVKYQTFISELLHRMANL
jgi:predicted DNA binding CopG/RHH family protein